MEQRVGREKKRLKTRVGGVRLGRPGTRYPATARLISRTRIQDTEEKEKGGLREDSMN